jgi:hypothetical protein
MTPEGGFLIDILCHPGEPRGERVRKGRGAVSLPHGCTRRTR